MTELRCSENSTITFVRNSQRLGLSFLGSTLIFSLRSQTARRFGSTVLPLASRLDHHPHTVARLSRSNCLDWRAEVRNIQTPTHTFRQCGLHKIHNQCLLAVGVEALHLLDCWATSQPRPVPSAVRRKSRSLQWSRIPTSVFCEGCDDRRCGSTRRPRLQNYQQRFPLNPAVYAAGYFRFNTTRVRSPV